MDFRRELLEKIKEFMKKFRDREKELEVYLEQKEEHYR
jgi:hypothetical protein